MQSETPGEVAAEADQPDSQSTPIGAKVGPPKNYEDLKTLTLAAVKECEELRRLTLKAIDDALSPPEALVLRHWIELRRETQFSTERTNKRLGAVASVLSDTLLKNVTVERLAAVQALLVSFGLDSNSPVHVGELALNTIDHMNVQTQDGWERLVG